MIDFSTQCRWKRRADVLTVDTPPRSGANSANWLRPNWKLTVSRRRVFAAKLQQTASSCKCLADAGGIVGRSFIWFHQGISP